MMETIHPLGPKMRCASRPTLVAVICTSLLAGCGNLAPSYSRPELPVPAQLQGLAPPLVSSGSIDEALSLKNSPFTTDKALAALMELALANNRDLRVAVLNIELAQSQWDLRKADLLPTVNLGLGGTRQTTASGGLTSSYNTGLSLPSIPAYEVDLFTRLRNLSDSAKAQYLATDEARKTVYIGLLGSVATSWLAWQSDTALLGLTEKTVKTRQTSFDLTKLRFDQGASSLLDLRSAESLLESARISLAQLQRQQSQDETTLSLLIGQSLPHWLRQQADVSPLNTSAASFNWVDIPSQLPSEVLLRRPDVAQAEYQLQAANANIGAARAAFFPKITLTSTLGRASSDLNTLFQSGTLGWSFGAQILQPIFDAGRNESNLKAAQASRAIAQAQYEKTIQAAFKEVSDALNARDTLKLQWVSQTAQTHSEIDRNRLTQMRFKQGSSSYLEVLDSERSVYAAQQALIQVQTLYAQNTVTLFRALGGGWMP